MYMSRAIRPGSAKGLIGSSGVALDTGCYLIPWESGLSSEGIYSRNISGGCAFGFVGVVVPMSQAEFVVVQSRQGL